MGVTSTRMSPLPTTMIVAAGFEIVSYLKATLRHQKRLAAKRYGCPPAIRYMSFAI